MTCFFSMNRRGRSQTRGMLYQILDISAFFCWPYAGWEVAYRREPSRFSVATEKDDERRDGPHAPDTDAIRMPISEGPELDSTDEEVNQETCAEKRRNGRV